MYIAALLMAFVTAFVTLPLRAQNGAGPTGTSGSPAPTSTSAADQRLSLSHIHGRAFHIKERGVFESLEVGNVVRANQPLKVGPRSRADVQVRDGGALALGPGTQLVLLPATFAAQPDAVVTALRLDNGYLKVELPAHAQRVRFDVAFDAWSAQLTPGEYAIETQNGEACVCTIRGSVRVSDARQWTATPEPGTCLRLGKQAPTQVSLASAEWARANAQRALLPIVTDLSRRAPREAIALAGVSPSVTPVPVPSTADESNRGGVTPELSAAANPGVGDVAWPPVPMPRTRSVRVTVAAPVPLTEIKAMERNVNRAVERHQKRVAATLVATVEAFPPGAGKPELPGLSADSASPAASTSNTNAPAASGRARGALSGPAVPPTQPDVRSSTGPQQRPPPEALAAGADVRTSPVPTLPAPVKPDAPVSTSGAMVSSTTPTATPAPRAEIPGGEQIALAPLQRSTPSATLTLGESAGEGGPPSEWIVNVETYASPETAEYQAAQLRARNVRASVRPEIVRGRSTYRVVVEGLATEQDANAMLRTLVADHGLRKAWILRKH